MKNNIKNKIIVIGFVAILVIVFLANLVVEDKEVSTSERRKLAQFPEVSIKNVISGSVINKWEKYVEDQFVGRDIFRGIKSFWSMNIFSQKDNNKLFEKEDAIYKMDYPLSEKNVKKSAQKIKEVYEKYLKGMNVYYSIIPEKNYYLENDDHLKLNYDELQQIVKEEVSDLKYIDIREELDLDVYYRTDLHWKQEKLQEVVRRIQKSMKFEEKEIIYETQNKGEFYGAYYGQLATNIAPDTLYVLTNETIKNCTVYNFETQENTTVYTENNSADRYDIFLSGATPLISIENPNSQTDKELILFRDSFGSSIAPLLVENYRKITLVDLRYISSRLLEEFIEFKDQDVLFLYSTVVLNQNILK